ncbi:MAG TPA: AbrB/MazE/SpoVT family DNA-binding domain-containing protein [Candidatus Thermoplasmatota archaeon]|nr:AbrB/MazE/SpoVT family DNA-binding domain-containing protein [Candidatus Thermoplasmatota archaeon]
MATKIQPSEDALAKLAKDLVFVDSVTVGERGQVAIPAELRRELELSGGSKLFVLRVAGTQGFLVLTAQGLADLARRAPPAVVAQVFRASPAQEGEE